MPHSALWVTPTLIFSCLRFRLLKWKKFNAREVLSRDKPTQHGWNNQTTKCGLPLHLLSLHSDFPAFPLDTGDWPLEKERLRIRKIKYGSRISERVTPNEWKFDSSEITYGHLVLAASADVLESYTVWWSTTLNSSMKFKSFCLFRCVFVILVFYFIQPITDCEIRFSRIHWKIHFYRLLSFLMVAYP